MWGHAGKMPAHEIEHDNEPSRLNSLAVVSVALAPGCPIKTQPPYKPPPVWRFFLFFLIPGANWQNEGICPDLRGRYSAITPEVTSRPAPVSKPTSPWWFRGQGERGQRSRLSAALHFSAPNPRKGVVLLLGGHVRGHLKRCFALLVHLLFSWQNNETRRWVTHLEIQSCRSILN